MRLRTPPKTLQRIFGDRLDVALDAGVVVEGIDRAEPVDGGADIFGEFVFPGDISRHRQRFGGGGPVLDGGRKILLPAVDGDDPGVAFGQEADGRGSDDAGRAGNPAIEANSIGHILGFPLAPPVIPDFGGFRAKSRPPRANESDYFI
jgi:hypothetical protein